MDTAFDLAAHRPWVVIVGGPNGAGKSTAASVILRDVLAVADFVNADVIAAGLSGLDPDGAAVAAGRVMLARLRELAAQRSDFAFEVTLASRTFAPWLQELRAEGYHVCIVYFWLASADEAVARVKERQRLGGHSIPEETVRRRYARSVSNCFELYLPLADSWAVYDNAGKVGPKLIARARPDHPSEIIDAVTWQAIRSSATPGTTPGG